jgi:hypothetical protein
MIGVNNTLRVSLTRRSCALPQQLQCIFDLKKSADFFFAREAEATRIAGGILAQMFWFDKGEFLGVRGIRL